MHNNELLKAAAAKIPTGSEVRFHCFRITDSSGNAISPAAAAKSNKLEVCQAKAAGWAKHGVICVTVDSETGEEV